MIPVKKMGASDSLDITKPPPQILKKVKLLTNPDYSKWSKYVRKQVIPWTLNPADYSHTGHTGTYWKDLSTKGKKSRIVKFFNTYQDLLHDFFICYEFSEKGRFHAHGFLTFSPSQRVDYFHFLEEIRKTFGVKKNRNACFKGVPFNSEKEDAFDKSFNYVTKDINVMYKSRYKIKWTSKKRVNKIRIKKQRVKLITQLLSPPI